MKDDPEVFAKAEHETAVDRALSALETAAGSLRVRSHFSNRGSGVAIEDLAEALRRFRAHPPA